MIKRTTRLRWRRNVRYRKRQVEDMGYQAEEHLEQHFFRRLSRLIEVRRFIASWTLLLIFLISAVVVQTLRLGNYYLSAQPAPGGTYTEGILGAFTNANPVYATSSVDSSVARLVFASLFKYNDQNQLVGDLAENWAVDDRGIHYTVQLKPNLTWHDSEPLTAADVVFTYRIIQNPDAKSPLATSWLGIGVEAKDPLTVLFTLPNPLGSFPNSMTNGIVPAHKLDGVPMAQMRSVSFNTASPVGAGPFTWQAVEVHGDTLENREQRIALAPNNTYHGTKPKLDSFIIRAFQNEQQLMQSFKSHELNGIAGLDTVPEDFEKNPRLGIYNIPLTGQVMVFLKTSHAVLQDPQVRRGILLATDTNRIISELGYPVIPAHAPLLESSVGYDKNLAQFPFNLAEAQKVLTIAGWQPGADGIRVKNGTRLAFALYSQSTKDYTYVTQALQKQWREAGIEAEVLLQSDSDLQTSLSLHRYDALLYGISVGIDPDVFAYWHSSQADVRSANRLNFSEYKSNGADIALEAGRTRTDTAVRAVKYRPFLETWRNDAPAVALYQPRFLYITDGQLSGLEEHSINSGQDRYANVENWMIRKEKTLK